MLDVKQAYEVNQILAEFTDVLTSLPGHTKTIQHEIHVNSDEIVRVKPYQLPFASQEFVKEEIKRLSELGVIEPSVSPFSSPIVLVKKKDGSLRFCIDFRKLNAITVLDATNIPLPEDLFAQLSDSTIFNSCDLCKAYWQISMHPDSRHFTAFQTPLGLMQWTRMPFGLVNAPATFCRLMRLVFNDEPMLLTYFDDTLLHTRSWEDHILGLRLLLTTLRNHGLTVNPGKLAIGQSSIEFLGHSVSNGTLAPIASHVSKVLHLKASSTKKQVRSLMGLISYYRAFIPKFSSITSPLTDLLRKGNPEKIIWSSECEKSLQHIQKFSLKILFSSFLTLMSSLLSEQMPLIMVLALSFFKSVMAS
ncbi:transposon Tf2-12 polyprotein [Elysia marginata]|uniref:Transposon Tf2-12 polyprotein n=1 Tax=Elysia marginata TaxID=1093978 RepID=A0AAV4IRB8_9GAST|nr:transposon Tf2-12 polyprotein [Elysia marginata]